MARSHGIPVIRIQKWFAQIAAGEFLKRRFRISRRFYYWAPVGIPLGLTLLAMIFVPMWLPSVNRLTHALSPPATAVSPMFASPMHRWESDIQRWSEGFGLDPNLVATVMQIESCGNPNAISSAGARGLFQVMPDHFAAGEDPLDPEINARRGLEYLATALLRAKGDIAKALAGYNGGHGIMEFDLADWPRETQRYVYWGTGIYAEAKLNSSEHPRLSEWFAAGGAALCVRAGS